MHAISVSTPRSGHHFLENILRECLQERFKYCEYYTPKTTCCKTIPCSNNVDHANNPAMLFMQKSHDHNLTDSNHLKNIIYIVQHRNPVFRALSEYELTQKQNNNSLNSQDMQTFLGRSAAYEIGFQSKWIQDNHTNHVIEYDELLADPGTVVGNLLKRLKLQMDTSTLNKAISLQQRLNSDSANIGAKFKPRTLETSRFFDSKHFSIYESIITAHIHPYQHKTICAPNNFKEHPIYQVFLARQQIMAGNLPEAFEHLSTAEKQLGNKSALLVSIKSNIIYRLYGYEKAKYSIQEAFDLNPDIQYNYTNMADWAGKEGDREHLIETLCSAVVRFRGNYEIISHFMHKYNLTESEISTINDHWQILLTREEVIDGFKFILGRLPENDEVISAHQEVGSWKRLRRILIESHEFREIYKQLDQ